MTFYSTQITFALLVPISILMLSVYIYWYKKNIALSMKLLLVGAFILRLILSFADPFLHDWDERFHALVAKNMIENPFTPMLHKIPILPYEIEAWCCNHIWVHKQPLFMWQMAISMKVLGVNEIAMRFPSVVIGTIAVYFIFDIAKIWTKNTSIAFIAALLFASSYYHLELISGRLSLDHNDVAFNFYMTGSFWCLMQYINSEKKMKWAILAGCFVGFAILNKWLTSILLFGGWGLFILLSKKDIKSIESWKHLLISVFVCCLVFIPWQIYIYCHFPAETIAMHKSNASHFTEHLDHPGTFMYHFDFMQTMFGYYLQFFFPIGILFAIQDQKISNRITLVFISMIAVIYCFFSFAVETKMPAFTFPVSGLIWIFIAIGLSSILGLGFQKFKYIKFYKTIAIMIILIYNIKPWNIINYRSIHNEIRNSKIINTQIYKNLSIDKINSKQVVLNCKTFENIDLMFYNNIQAYHWYPNEQTIDSLINAGYNVYAFESFNNQILPAYIHNNQNVNIINKKLN